MIDILYALIMLAMCILGMLGAFFLGTRKYQERMFESSNKSYEIEDPEEFIEPTEKEYQASISSYDFYGPNKEEEQETG